MKRFLTITLVGAGVALGVAAGIGESRAIAAAASLDRSDASDLRRTYGAPVALGDGRARTYIVTDITGTVPVELGVALDERALENLPASGSGHHTDHGETHEFILPLPERHGTQFQFVEMNWNPTGHVPPGVYDVPHFDFHFYTISKADRDGILPSDPAFVAKGNNLPAEEYVPPFTVPLAPPDVTPGEFAVPKMGVHWSDVRTPELQGMLGKPEAFQPFTATFIIGSWDGRFTFWEPMITRAHILEKKTAKDPAVRDQILPIAVPAKYQQPGYYPTAYRIMWDAEAKEYRIALVGLAKQS